MSQGHSQGDHQEPSLPPMGLNRPSTTTGEVVRLDDDARPGQSLGQSIQAARDAKGMSAADLAQSLNLDLRIVEAIEGNRFEAAPDPIYVRAYLKHWARLLEVDPAPWIAAYNVQNAIEPEQQDLQRKTGGRATLDVMTPRKASRNVHVGKSGRPLWIVVLALMVALVVAAAALLAMPPAWQKWVEARLGGNVSTEMAGDRPIALIPLAPPGDGGKAPAGAPPSTEASAGTPTSSAAMPPPDTASAAPDSSAIPATVLPALPSPPTPDQSAIAPAPTASPESDTSGAQGETNVVASSGTDGAPVSVGQPAANLVIRATSADCWVEVRNAAGKRLVYDVLKSGEARQVPGDGPFTVVLGNPSAVEVLWKGAPVTLGTPNATTGVVRTTIGG